MTLPWFPVLFFSQWYNNRWSHIDLIGIHSSLTRFIIQVDESFVSTCRTMYNSSNIASCPKSLPFDMRHCLCLKQFYRAIIETALFLFIYVLYILSMYNSWLFVSIDNFNISTFNKIPVSFCCCPVGGFSVAREHPKDSLYRRVLYILADLFASPNRPLWSLRSESLAHRMHSYLYLKGSQSRP